jgi:hypothetical protein
MISLLVFFLLNLLKDTMNGLESMDKAVWIKEILYTFCDLCIKVIDMRMRSNLILISIKRNENFL